MRQEFDGRMRNNPLHFDLFERSSQSLSSSTSSSTLDMAQKDDGNVRRRLGDYDLRILSHGISKTSYIGYDMKSAKMIV